MNVLSLLPYVNPTYEHEPMVYIVQKFLKKNGIKSDTEELRIKLWGHPWSQSLLSIYDVLNDLNLSPVAYRSSIEELTTNFNTPIIVNIKLDNDCFLLIEKVEDGKVYGLTETGEEMQFYYDKFANAWNGAAIKIEKPKSKATNFSLSNLNYLPLILLSSIILILSIHNISQNYANNLIGIFIIIANLAGLVLSWLLISEHENKNNPLVSQLCSSETNNGCNAVVHSKFSMITKNISWSDVGFAFFSGLSFIAIIFQKPQLFFYLSIVAPLYSLYAIYIQAFVVKKWCRLCMSVHVIVLINFIYAIFLFNQIEFSAYLLLIEILFFMIPGLGYMVFKPLFLKLRERKTFKKRFLMLKSNPDIFNQLLRAKEKLDIPNELKTFQIGNLEATNELTIISNPFCGPCKKAHETIEEWLKSPINFKINIIFAHKEDCKKKEFVSYLSSRSANDSLSDLIDDWYNRGDASIEEWASKHNLHLTDLPYSQELHSSWYAKSGVKGTPTFFVNGYELPRQQYALEDIKIFLNES